MMTPPAETPKNRSQQRSETTRAQLLAAFRQSFLDKGYEATTTQNVLGVTGLSKGALYHHFRSKVEVIEGLYEAEVRQTIGKAVEGLDPNDPPLGRLKAACLAWMAEAQAADVSKILFEVGPSALGYEAARAIEDAISLSRIEGLLLDAEDAGAVSLDHPKLTAAMLNALVAEAALYARRSGQDVTSQLASAIDSLFASIGVPE